MSENGMKETVKGAYRRTKFFHFSPPSLPPSLPPLLTNLRVSVHVLLPTSSQRDHV